MVLSPENRGGGTGFHIQAPSGKYYILTNKHVCEVAIKLPNGQEYVDVADGYKSTKRRVIARHKRADLCLIEGVYDYGIRRISDPISVLPVVTSGHGGLAINTSAIGFMRGEHTALICTQRIMFGCAKVERIQSDSYTMIVIGGHSGSPIMSPTGALVGVIFAGSSRHSLAVPPHFVRELLSDK